MFLYLARDRTEVKLENQNIKKTNKNVKAQEEIV